MSVIVSSKTDASKRLADGAACVAAALDYLALGWPVLPLCPPDHVGVGREHGRACQSPGKAPVVSWREYQERLPTADEVERWWKTWPNANVGMALGPVSGLVRIDVDGADGERRLQELSRGDLPPTLEFVSGRANGGRGLLYRIPPGAVLRTTADKPGAKQELRLQAAGAQTVLPPSRHAGGTLYTWQPGRGPADMDPAPAPAWLLEALWPENGKQRGRELADGEFVPEGARNATLASMAGTMRRRGMTQESITAALLAENDLRCDPPLPPTEVEAIAASIASYPPASANGAPSSNGDTVDETPAIPWPDPPGEEAFYGLAGEIVREIEPETEADPVGLLAQILVAFGNVIGRTAFYRVEGDRHFLNMFAVLIGETGRARKGTSWGRVRSPFGEIDRAWADSRIMGGLSSGEGLIWNVRDPIIAREKIKEKGRITGLQEYEADPGQEDKRLLVFEPEYASVLKQVERQGNVLSAILRQSWETGNLRTLTKNSPAQATAAHISLIGHVTPDELRRYLTTTEAANGSGNRPVYLCVRRSKCLPEGGQFVNLDALRERLAGAIAFAKTAAELHRDEEARAIWAKVYPSLSEGKPGLVGALTARAEAQVLRLSCIYALLEKSSIIRAEHLLAALAFWGYCERSTRYVFGDSLGDEVADAILAALRRRPAGLTKTDIRDLFDRHQSAARIGRALATLDKYGLAYCAAIEDTGGRPAERWFAGAAPATKATKAT